MAQPLVPHVLGDKGRLTRVLDSLVVLGDSFGVCQLFPAGHVHPVKTILVFRSIHHHVFLTVFDDHCVAVTGWKSDLHVFLVNLTSRE